MPAWEVSASFGRKEKVCFGVLWGQRRTFKRTHSHSECTGPVDWVRPKFFSNELRLHSPCQERNGS